jgi:hypothetical protein
VKSGLSSAIRVQISHFVKGRFGGPRREAGALIARKVRLSALSARAGHPGQVPLPVHHNRGVGLNGCVSYVVTDEAFGLHGGGYEMRLTSCGTLEPTAGQQIAEACIGMAEQMTDAADASRDSLQIVERRTRINGPTNRYVYRGDEGEVAKDAVGLIPLLAVAHCLPLD